MASRKPKPKARPRLNGTLYIRTDAELTRELEVFRRSLADGEFSTAAVARWIVRTALGSLRNQLVYLARAGATPSDGRRRMVRRVRRSRSAVRP